MPITPKVLDEILKDYQKPEDLLSENGLLQQLTKALIERALNGDTDASSRLRKAFSCRQQFGQFQKRFYAENSQRQARVGRDQSPA